MIRTARAQPIPVVDLAKNVCIRGTMIRTVHLEAVKEVCGLSVAKHGWTTTSGLVVAVVPEDDLWIPVQQVLKCESGLDMSFDP